MLMSTKNMHHHRYFICVLKDVYLKCLCTKCCSIKFSTLGVVAFVPNVVA